MSASASQTAGSILVVDDSSVDRAVVARVLEEEGGYTVQHASNGREAMACLESQRPAAVVTDLYMPEMDGMELVRAVRRQYGSVPVILMTGSGSEEAAMTALASGAADYVPKSKLHSRLIDSLDAVLALAANRRARHRLLKALDYQELRYTLENDSSLFAPLSDLLAEIALRLDLVDQTGSMRLAKALTEALRNAMYHGNLELPAGQYEDGAQLPSGDADLIAMLHNEGVYQGRQIHLSATFAHDEARFTVRDEGPGFNACERMEIDRDPSRLTAAVGHGLVLIRMFMDNVTFNALGNEITMVKRRAEAPSETTGDGKKEQAEKRKEAGDDNMLSDRPRLF